MQGRPTILFFKLQWELACIRCIIESCQMQTIPAWTIHSTESCFIIKCNSCNNFAKPPFHMLNGNVFAYITHVKNVYLRCKKLTFISIPTAKYLTITWSGSISTFVQELFYNFMFALGQSDVWISNIHYHAPQDQFSVLWGFSQFSIKNNMASVSRWMSGIQFLEYVQLTSTIASLFIIKGVL